MTMEAAACGLRISSNSLCFGGTWRSRMYAGEKRVCQGRSGLYFHSFETPTALSNTWSIEARRAQGNRNSFHQIFRRHSHEMEILGVGHARNEDVHLT